MTPPQAAALAEDAASIGEVTCEAGGSPQQAALEAQSRARQAGASEAEAQRAAGLAAGAAAVAAGGSVEEGARAAAQGAEGAGATRDEAAQAAGEAAGAAVLAGVCPLEHTQARKGAAVEALQHELRGEREANKALRRELEHSRGPCQVCSSGQARQQSDRDPHRTRTVC